MIIQFEKLVTFPNLNHDNNLVINKNSQNSPLSVIIKY